MLLARAHLMAEAARLDHLALLVHDRAATRLVAQVDADRFGKRLCWLLAMLFPGWFCFAFRVRFTADCC